MSCCFLFATLDSNIAGNEGGGDFGGIEEEDQGNFADQGKPPFDASLILHIPCSCIIPGFAKCMFFIYYVGG
jgi:hypothetical protein